MKQIISVIFTFLFLLPALVMAQSTHTPTEMAGVEDMSGEKLPLALEFKNELGESVILGKYFSSGPVLLTPIYYECPMLCNLILNALVKTINQSSLTLGEDYTIVSYSIDPGETPELAQKKKQSYMKQLNNPLIKPTDWTFLTGSEKNIKRLSDTIGFKYSYDPKTGEYAHVSSLQILTPDGRISKYLNDLKFEVSLFDEVLREAKKSKISSFFDQLLLVCYKYDPATGKYGLIIENVIRIFGTLTAIVLIGFVLINIRNDKNNQLAA